MTTKYSISEPTVAIILLNYNSYDYTKACLESLQESNYENFQIVIVDNDSLDRSFEKLKQLETERIHIIQSGKNAGFAYGNNIGIRYAKNKDFDYILLLNNDTLVTKEFLTKIVFTATEFKSDITTCRIMYNDNKDMIWYGGGSIDWFNQRATHWGINTIYNGDTEIKAVTFISGCCMLLSKNCIKRIGDLPEEYFMYYEDLDYCQHALNQGLKLIYDPKPVIYHCVSASGGGSQSPFVIEWSNRSRRRFVKKYHENLRQPKRIMSTILCEMKSIIKILKSKDRTGGLRAYYKSFSL